MDSSQSSDVFSDHLNQSDTVTSNIMDVNTYESLLNNTKAALSHNISSLTSSSFCDHFTSLLDDSKLCISQALRLLSEIVESHISTLKLEHYLEDAVSILQLLSNFIKNIVESYAISCCQLKTFPTTTGEIIMDVFTHCKNSETAYGIHLASVQQQLKDLFRTCHELQLTYLMVLEKHFVFDLAEKEELDILVKALNINLHIGEVVQALDVKTMAEQWKAYTMICEKYANYLKDTSVYQDCVTLLCAMVLNNMKTSMEVEQDEKLIVRSLKVTNFTIKILLKMCTIFRYSLVKPYQCIIEFLINVYLHNPSYLETVEAKSTQFSNIVSINVLNPTDLLLKELLNDEGFANVIINYYINSLQLTDKILGYIVLLATVMQALQKQNQQHINIKSKLISQVLYLLPDCYIWINMGLKFEINHQNKKQSVGLFEYLLIYATSLALEMNREEYCLLEKNMCEAILSVDTMRALFASNLWIILARIINNKQLLLSQLMSLCRMYQKLETIRQFSTSPQKIHLESTITSMFEITHIDDRVKLYKQTNPLINPKNMSLWSVLKIIKLPLDFQRTVEEDIIEKLNTEFQKFNSGHQYQESFDLAKVMNLAATCSFNALENAEGTLLEAWAMACPKNLRFLSDVLDFNTMWFLDYMEALVSLTCAMKFTIYGRSSHVVKILHVMSELIRLGNTELNLLLMDLLCKLVANPIHDENKTEAAKIANETFRMLIQDSDNFIRCIFFKMLRKYDNKYLDQIVSSIVCGDHSLLSQWQNFIKHDKDKINNTKLKETLTSINNFKYRHKCVELRDDVQCSGSEKIQNSCSSNFDLADIDSLFDNESDCEPLSKKVKIDTTKDSSFNNKSACEPISKKVKIDLTKDSLFDNKSDNETLSKKVKTDGTEDVESILERLEQDASLLCEYNGNRLSYKHKKRIKLLSEKLISIVTNE